MVADVLSNLPASARLENSQKHLGSNDGNILVAFQNEEIGVFRDNETGVAGLSGGEERIVSGITADCRDVNKLHHGRVRDQIQNHAKVATRDGAILADDFGAMQHFQVLKYNGGDTLSP